MHRLLVLPALLAIGCAPQLRMPAVTKAEAWDARSEWTPPATFARTSPSGYELRRDQADSDLGTRVSVTTHRGIYTGWVQKPQISFYVQFLGGEPAPTPAIVALLFRTLEPQALTGNQLVLGCGTVTDTVSVTPRSELEAGNVTSHFLTYHLPIASVAKFASCPEGTLGVGQLTARYSGAQLRAVQVLLRAAAAGSSSPDP